MNLRSAHDQAEGVRTPRQAARLYNNIEYELALGEHPAEHQQRGERALRHLEEHFPGVKENARDVTEPPQTSRNASRNLHPRAERRPAPAPRRPAPPARRQRARQTAGAVVSRAYDTASDTTAGELVGQLLLGGFALSIFYLFLTRAAAAGKLFEGATNVVRAVVSPVVDPLNPKGALR